MALTIRIILPEERPTALSLIWRVFREYEAPDYTSEGVDEFYKSIHNEGYLARLRMYGAFAGEDLVGVIAIRNEGTHIALFFVDGSYHRKGIGRRLFQAAMVDCPHNKMTVHSSPYAVPIYRKLGFVDMDAEQIVKGLRFTPMEYSRAQ